MNRKTAITTTLIVGYFAFVAISLLVGFAPGEQIGYRFTTFAVAMVKILPCAFILIGLFEVWVNRKMIEDHMGHGSGPAGYFWSILLAGTTVGGLYVAFPFAYTLHAKGAKLSIVFTYLGCAAVCRVPMTIFEASFLGLKFSLVRLAVSLPLIIGTSVALGAFLEKRGYTVCDGK